MTAVARLTPGEWQLAGQFGSMHAAKSAARQIMAGRYSKVYAAKEFDAEARPSDMDWEVWIRYRIK